jgi:hypothetical protein
MAAEHEDKSVPSFQYVEGSPRVTQVIERAKQHSLVFFGKEHKCSPRKLVINVLRHLTEPYGYRWMVVPENKYAFDIIDCAWIHGDNKFFPKLGRVFVNPLQRGVEGGISMTFYPKFIIQEGERPLGDFLERVKGAFDEERVKFAMWEEQYAWLPLRRAGRDDADHELYVKINEDEVGYEDNLTRILVTNLRRMRSTWILVQSFAKRMPKIDTSRQTYPLVR